MRASHRPTRVEAELLQPSDLFAESVSATASTFPLFDDGAGAASATLGMAAAAAVGLADLPVAVYGRSLPGLLKAAAGEPRDLSKFAAAQGQTTSTSFYRRISCSPAR